MKTYTQVYLNYDERKTLEKLAGVNIVVKNRDGKDLLVGHYLHNMAEQRRCNLNNFNTALLLIKRACEQIEPLSYESFWVKFNIPYADLLAKQYKLQMEDMLKAASICLNGTLLATEPEEGDEDD